MVNRHLLKTEFGDATTEKLVEPSRVTVKFSNELEEGGLRSEMTLDALVEPIEIKIGFRELDFFNKLNVNMQEFLTRIGEE